MQHVEQHVLYTNFDFLRNLIQTLAKEKLGIHPPQIEIDSAMFSFIPDWRLSNPTMTTCVHDKNVVCRLISQSFEIEVNTK